MKKTISVIIPVYNEQSTIAACLSSLLGQTIKPKEIVVIDDGSTDKTREVISSFPVTLLTQKHLGPAAARNLGVSKSTGDILVFVDADMTFEMSFLENLATPIISGKAKGVFNVDEFVGNYSNLWARNWNYNQNLRDKRRMNPRSLHDTKDFRAIERKEFERAGGFSGRGYTDSQSLSEKLGYLPTPVSGAISYHDNPSTIFEVFSQARWVGGRQMKWGTIGRIINLIRHSLPVSLFIGMSKEVIYQSPGFLLFMVVYDLGYSAGIIGSLLGSSGVK